MTPAGSRLLPLRSAATAPASIVSMPFGSSEPAIHFLRAVTGIGRREEPGAARAVGDRPQRMRDAAGGDHHVGAAGVAILPASILVCMPPRESSEPAAPAIASIAGVMRSTSGTSLACALPAGGAS